MSTLPIQDKLVAVMHLTKDATNTNKEEFVIDMSLQAVAMNIQPASAEDTVLVDGIFAQVHRAFTTESGILSGDHITVSGTGSTYVVKGVQDWCWDPIPHYELLLVSMEN